MTLRTQPYFLQIENLTHYDPNKTPPPLTADSYDPIVSPNHHDVLVQNLPLLHSAKAVGGGRCTRINLFFLMIN